MGNNPTHVMRTSDPGDVALLVAHNLGFWPSESVTLVSLRGSRRRCGLIARLDLEDALSRPEAADVLIEALHEDHADAICLIIWTDEHDHDQAAAMAEPLALALLAADLPAEVNTVCHRTIRRHGCDQDCCTSAAPLPTDSPLAATLVGAGMAPLSDRQAVLDSLNGTPLPTAALQGARPASRQRWLATAARFDAHPGTVLEDAEVADLLLSAESIDIRDRLIASAITGHVPLALLIHLAQRAHHTHEGIHAALAMVAWLNSSPVLAEAALARLPRNNSLGRLITQAIALHMPPVGSREFLLGAALDLTS